MNKKMNEQKLVKRSRYLSFVLRHQPQAIGIKLDVSGWVGVDDLLEALEEHNRGMTLEELEEVVRLDDKQRYAFSEDGQSIRATQGHSVDVDLGYESAVPPKILYHGTPDKFVESIKQEGLKKMNRHHVHLHIDVETSMDVGQRRGKPVLLKIRALEMHEAGYEFFVTPNDVWLTDHVPPEYIDTP